MRNGLLKTIPACVWLLVVFASPAFCLDTYSDIEVIRQDARSLEFVYRPAEVQWFYNDSGSAVANAVRVGQAAFHEIPGEPRLPVRLFHFGLPPDAVIAVEIIDQHWQNKPLVALPQYVPLLADGRRAEDAVTLSAGEYVTTPRFPDETIETLPTGSLRNLRTGGIAVYPVLYFPGEQRAEVLESMTIRVVFSGGSSGGTVTGNGVFDKVLAYILLNYESARHWQQPNNNALARTVDDDPFGSSDIWHKLRIGVEGIYRIDLATADALGLNPAEIEDVGQLRLFYGGGKTLPVVNSVPLPEFREMAIRTTGFADGNWDEGDYLEFYAQNLHRWEINPATNEFINVLHPFETNNIYWLATKSNLETEPLRVHERDGSLTVVEAAQIFDVDAWAHHERNEVLRVRSDGYIGDFYRWYWRSSQIISISLYNALEAVDGPARLYLATYSFGNQPELYVNGLPVTPTYTDLANDSTVFDLPSFAGSNFQIRFPDDLAGATYLDSYDLAYRRRLALRGGRLKFAAPDTSATAVFTVTNRGTAPVVWDITDPYAAEVISGLDLDGSAIRFQSDLAAGVRRVFWVGDDGLANSPISAEQRQPAPLRTAENQADFLAVGPRLFVEAAEGYLNLRSSISGLTTQKIAIEDIYDNFSSGLIDPLAIRRFLKYAVENWPSPSPQYVLFIGDGHYDLADNLGTGMTSYVPPYLGPDELLPSDENYLYFGDNKLLADGAGDPYPDMIVGRWPAKNTEHVRTIAEKIDRYLSPATYGPWRNRIAMVADDEATGECSYDPGNEIHIIGAEYLSAVFIPAGFEQRKIYLTEFPFGATCRSKPEARSAILNLINDGVILIDYVGHGNPDLWAHEHVLERATDVPKMLNKDKLTVMFTASCSNGFFDDPTNEGLAEELVRWSEGGAVAAISATRLVFADANLSLNALVFDLLLGGDDLSLGEALYIAKTLRQFTPSRSCPNPPCEQSNDRKYILFGDPAMSLGVSRYNIAIDLVDPDTMAALGEVTVSGRITDDFGNTLTGFNGTAEFLVADALRQRRYQASSKVRIDYKLPGGTIFRGSTEVTDGSFSFGFIVPKDVTYGGNTAKITGYATSGTVDAGGGLGGLVLGGTAPALTDTLGPSVLVYLDDLLLGDGMAVLPSSELTIVLADTSGLNLTGEPGHGITIELAGIAETTADITESFAYDPDDYRRGRAQFTLPSDESSGPVSLTVKAWDNANNSTQITMNLTVSETADFRILEFLNYPNPFETTTTFYFRTNGLPSTASIQIFTVAGRLIRTIENVSDGQTVWDGNDEYGHKVGNGVYLTRLIVGGQAVETMASNADNINNIAERVQKVVLWR